jgi:hypothetical protein
LKRDDDAYNVIPADSLTKQAMQTTLLLLALCTAVLVSAEVTVLKAVRTIYDQSPKIRIRGAGFEAEKHNIILDLAAQGQPCLRSEKEFEIVKDEDGLVLRLVAGRKSVNGILVVPSV